MDDDTSNDVEAVEMTESEADVEIRPIMLLLKRLIRNKQNTVMTNTQIIEILKKEFSIDIQTCHELEVDIYIKIIKKYLKDWPQWEELERISSKLSSVNNMDAVTKVLNTKYKNLKDYLGVMLEAAKPLAKKAVAEVEPEIPKEENIENSEVVMEVNCTRQQLNQLVFRRPRKDLNNAIFNVTKIDPTRISLNTLSFESILNFSWTKLSILLPTFVFIRDIVYTHKHTLVNKVRDDRLAASTEILDTRLFNRGRKSKEQPKSKIFQYFDKILQLCCDQRIVQLLQVIFHVLQTDLRDAPEMIKVPSSYQKIASPYKYVRYLYVENEENKDPRYDLQLEEVVSPVYLYLIGRLGKYPETLPPVVDWLKLECMVCKIKFSGTPDMMDLVQAHFSECHYNEPDWQCTHCKRLFSMDFLSKNRWHHEC